MCPDVQTNTHSASFPSPPFPPEFWLISPNSDEQLISTNKLLGTQNPGSIASSVNVGHVSAPARSQGFPAPVEPGWRGMSRKAHHRAQEAGSLQPLTDPFLSHRNFHLPERREH